MLHVNNKNSLWPDSLTNLSEKQKTALSDNSLENYKNLLKKESIPLSPFNINLLNEFYIPFAHWITQQSSCTFTLGINGAQGTGKSTLAKIIKQIIVNEFNKSVVVISIDDLYLSKRDRLKISQSIHPLLATRGVPGTHDISLGISIIEKLTTGSSFPVQIPVFNKANDDRNHTSAWQTVEKRPDIVLLEGWCVGSLAENDTSLESPINSLEMNKDPDGKWRHYVNERLKIDYQLLFSKIDELVMLKVPSFNKVIEWRYLQESKLKETSISTLNNDCMSEQEIKQFTLYFERITRHTLKEMPNRATFIFEIDNNHYITNTIYNK